MNYSFRRRHEAGNMFIYILGAIFLLGVLVVLARGSFQEGAGVSGEKLTVRATEIERYASQLEQAVNLLQRNGISESDIRFADESAPTAYGTAHDQPARQIFEPDGGGVEYKIPLSDITTSAQKWQFYGTTQFTGLGTNSGTGRQAELIAVLPNVTRDFCKAVNLTLGQKIDLDLDTDPGSDCIYKPGAEFTGTFLSGSAVNALDDTKLSKIPASEACVKCAAGGYHYYRVLLVR